MGSIYTQMLSKALAAGAPPQTPIARESAFGACQSDTPRGRGASSHLRPGLQKPLVRHWLDQFFQIIATWHFCPTSSLPASHPLRAPYNRFGDACATIEGADADLPRRTSTVSDVSIDSIAHIGRGAGYLLSFIQLGSNFSRGSIFWYFSGKCEISKIILCVILLFSCILFKTDPQPHLALFQWGSTPAPEGSNPQTPVNFYHAVVRCIKVHCLSVRPALHWLTHQYNVHGSGRQFDISDVVSVCVIKRHCRMQCVMGNLPYIRALRVLALLQGTPMFLYWRCAYIFIGSCIIEGSIPVCSFTVWLYIWVHVCISDTRIPALSRWSPLFL